MSRIGIIGGAFNPPHNGHLHLIQSFHQDLGLDTVLMMPTAVSPHKQTPDLAPAQDRLEMCRLAAQSLPYVQVSDYETGKGGKSYTAETLAYLYQQDPDAELWFLMGSDMFLTVQNWYRPKEVLRLAKLYCVSREPAVYQSMLTEHAKNTLRLPKDRYYIAQAEPFPVSSTELREKIGTDAPLDGLIPDAVITYIKAKKLYV